MFRLPRLPRRWNALATLALAPLALLATWAGGVFVGGNVHVIVAGQAYRSAQLAGWQLAGTLEHYRIRTVVNLRGANPGEAWFDRELVVSREHGVGHVDFGLSAGEELSDEQLDALAALLRAVPKPVLIHCAGGADRTGLAAAVYRYAIEHVPSDTAAAELSFRFGHLPWLVARTRAMDRSFDRYMALARAFEHAPAPGG